MPKFSLTSALRLIVLRGEFYYASHRAPSSFSYILAWDSRKVCPYFPDISGIQFLVCLRSTFGIHTETLGEFSQIPHLACIWLVFQWLSKSLHLQTHGSAPGAFKDHCAGGRLWSRTCGASISFELILHRVLWILLDHRSHVLVGRKLQSRLNSRKVHRQGPGPLRAGGLHFLDPSKGRNRQYRFAHSPIADLEWFLFPPQCWVPLVSWFRNVSREMIEPFFAYIFSFPRGKPLGLPLPTRTVSGTTSLVTSYQASLPCDPNGWRSPFLGLWEETVVFSNF